MGIILIIIGIILIVIGCKKIETKDQQIKNIEKHIADLLKEYEIKKQQVDSDFQQLQQKNKYEINTTKNEINFLKKEEQELKWRKEEIEKSLKSFQDNIDKIKNHQAEILQDGFQNYSDLLDVDYQKKNKEYDNLIKMLEKSYDEKCDDLNAEVMKVQNELDKLRQTKHAQLEAARREQQILDNLSNYCLSVDELELADIQMLEKIKPKLNKPRVLSMLIWSTFFQKKMTQLCNNIVGVTIKSGIYKITNIETKECYIGQAKNISERWKEHAKCGLGIDTPAGNKLYKAIQEYGLWNFAFEVLEECDNSLLNEKERYYIDLYDSYNFGYNSNKGVSK